MVVLNEFVESGSFFVVENDAEHSEEDGLEDFQNDVQGLSELIDPVAFEDGPKLGAPTGIMFFLDGDFSIEERHFPFMFPLVVLIGMHHLIDYLIEFLLDALLSKIFLPFYFSQHQSLLVHHLHVVVGWVGVSRHWKTHLVEVGHRLLGLPVVDDVPLHHQHNMVELHENLR